MLTSSNGPNQEQTNQYLLNTRKSQILLDIINTLMSKGFTKKQVLLANKLYILKSVEDAINIMTRNCNNKYIHIFINSNDSCEICGGKFEEHDNTYHSNNLIINSELCSICQIDLEEQIELICNHIYCRECLNYYINDNIIRGKVK